MAYERAGQPGRTPQCMKAWGGPSPELCPPHSPGAGSRLTLRPWTSTARAREEGPLGRNDRLIHGIAKSLTRLSNFTLNFHFSALEKEMATYSIVLAWRIPGMGEPRGLLCMGSHRVGQHDEDLREPLVRRQGSQVSMRVARGSASWLSSHGRGLGRKHHYPLTAPVVRGRAVKTLVGFPLCQALC